jgi:hypothetical protein
MKIRVYKKIRDNAYDVVIKTTEWSQSDINLFREFGEPEIDVGTNGHPVFVRVMTGFPVRGTFVDEDSSTDETPEDRALVWKDNVIRKITTAVEAQRQLVDGFTGEEIHMV